MDPIPIREIVEAVGGRWQALSRPGSDRVMPPLERVALSVSTDSRSCGGGALYVPMRGSRADGHDFIADVAHIASAALVEESRAARVVERVAGTGADLGLIFVPDALDALEKLAGWYRRRQQSHTQVIAITGSSGKTTVKEFTGQLLSRHFPTGRAPKSFNNRLGVALTLLSAARSTRFLVVEMGTSAPGEIARLSRLALPDYAVITGVGQAHLQGLGDLQGVIRAKAEIFQGCKPGSLAFLPQPIPGEEHFLRQARLAECEVIRYGWRLGFEGGELRGRETREGYWITDCIPTLFPAGSNGTPGEAPSVPLAAGPGRGPVEEDEPGCCERPGFRFQVNWRRHFELPLPGRHNVFNALAAMAVAQEIGVGWEALRPGIGGLELPPMRLQMSRAGGVTIIEDVYNANPSSLRAALSAVRDIPLQQGGRWHLVLGDLLELGASSRSVHRELGEEIARMQLFHGFWTLGAESRHAGDGAAAAGLPSRAAGLESSERLAGELLDALRPGDGILFKASRGIALERVSGRLKDLLNRPGGEEQHGKIQEGAASVCHPA